MAKKKEEKTRKQKRIRVTFTIVNPSGRPVPVSSAAKYIQLPTMYGGVAPAPTRAPRERDDDDDDDDIDF